MKRSYRCAGLFVLAILFSRTIAAEEVLFEDRFDNGLSDKWEINGLKESDYRIRDGGLELRVQPGRFRQETPMLKVTLPFTSADTVTASVDVTILDRFTEPAEMAGFSLTRNDRTEFSVRKENLHGHLVFVPGYNKFIGEKGEEYDPGKYAVTYFPALEESGALRIIVRQHYAYFQIGPSKTGKYQNFFHSAITQNTKKRGFALFAVGGAPEKEHWVRFDNFIVTQ